MDCACLLILIKQRHDEIYWTWVAVYQAQLKFFIGYHTMIFGGVGSTASVGLHKCSTCGLVFTYSDWAG